VPVFAIGRAINVSGFHGRSGDRTTREFLADLSTLHVWEKRRVGVEMFFLAP